MLKNKNYIRVKMKKNKNKNSPKNKIKNIWEEKTPGGILRKRLKQTSPLRNMLSKILWSLIKQNSA